MKKYSVKKKLSLCVRTLREYKYNEETERDVSKLALDMAREIVNNHIELYMKTQKVNKNSFNYKIATLALYGGFKGLNNAINEIYSDIIYKSQNAGLINDMAKKNSIVRDIKHSHEKTVKEYAKTQLSEYKIDGKTLKEAEQSHSWNLIDISMKDNYEERRRQQLMKNFDKASFRYTGNGYYTKDFTIDMGDDYRAEIAAEVNKMTEFNKKLESVAEKTLFGTSDNHTKTIQRQAGLKFGRDIMEGEVSL